jgi:hypothetical protein
MLLPPGAYHLWGARWLLCRVWMPEEQDCLQKVEGEGGADMSETSKEERCGNCLWLRSTGMFTSAVCAIPVPRWVDNSGNLQTRAVSTLDGNCLTWKAQVKP